MDKGVHITMMLLKHIEYVQGCSHNYDAIKNIEYGQGCSHNYDGIKNIEYGQG